MLGCLLALILVGSIRVLVLLLKLLAPVECAGREEWERGGRQRVSGD